MPKGIFLVAKDLYHLEGYTTYQGAWDGLKTIKAALGKSMITVQDYATYRQVSLEEIYRALYPQPKKKAS
jgi:hypothetical protein